MYILFYCQHVRISWEVLLWFVSASSIPFYFHKGSGWTPTLVITLFVLLCFFFFSPNASWLDSCLLESLYNILFTNTARIYVQTDVRAFLCMVYSRHWPLFFPTLAHIRNIHLFHFNADSFQRRNMYDSSNFI